MAEVQPEPASKKTSQQQVMSDKYMVVTAHELASKAAANIIEKGGNAIDAAVAAQMVLAVVEPQSSGIGGGGFLLYYDKSQDEIISFDGRETAPANAKPNMFLTNDGKAMSFMEAVKSGKSVGVPGLLKMLQMAHNEYGDEKWQALFNDAINIAKNGFPISNRLHDSIKYANNFAKSNDFSKLYFDSNNQPLQKKHLLINKYLARVLKVISKQDANFFYDSKLTDKIVKEARKNGSVLTRQDFKNYQAIKREAVCSNYRDYKVCGMGLPSSGGITTLQTLKILENFNLGKTFNINALHKILEAQKLSFADRNQYLADSDFVEVPRLDLLLDKNYTKKRTSLINPFKASKNKAKAGNFDIINGIDNSFDAPSTTHISIVDKQGNAVSLTSSVEHSFGSGLVVSGFVLNNQLTDFAFQPIENGKLVANRVQGNKRPRSSMSPTIIFDKNGNLHSIIGSPGGSSIIAYVTKTIIALLDWNMNLKQATDLPNFMNKNSQSTIEIGNNNIAKNLQRSYRHKIVFKETTSGINSILINNGKLIGYSDPRREGKAVGGSSKP